MLRVGLTGDLGSGKSTVARMLAARGAIVFSSDDMARTMMRPGHAVYAEIVEHFGPSILVPDETLDRKKLAALAFDHAHPRIEELNAIIHPAVIEAQAEQIAALAHTNPHAIVVIESALIFSTKYAPTSQTPGVTASKEARPSRFDRILMVTAPDHEKIARFIKRVTQDRKLSTSERTALEADAHRRLALQHTASHTTDCIILHNDGTLEQLEPQVETAWRELQELEKTTR